MNSKRRARLSSAVSFLCGTNKLKAQQEMLEKMQEKLILSLKSFSTHEKNEIQGGMRTTERNMVKEVEEQQNELLEIFDLLKQITREIKDEEKLRTHDMSYFRQKLFELETKIHKLIANCSKEVKKLQEEETVITTELDIMEARIESWSKVNELSNARRAQSASRINCTCTTDDLCPEIKNFAKYVEKFGGHTGGWSEEDHVSYVHLRQNHGPEDTAYLLNRKLPDISVDRVLDHDRWFEEYIHLKSKRRTAIKNWRAGKKAEHAPVCDEYVEPKAEPKKSKPKKDPELQEKIKLWQAVQKNKKEQQLKEKIEEEEMRKKMEQLWRKNQEKRRAFVNEYKRERMSYEQALEIAKQTEEERTRQLSAQQANSMLRQFRNEDMKYILKRKEILQQKQEIDSRSIISSSSSSVKVSRNPERLFQPTEVWRLKTAKSDEPEDLMRPIIHLRNMPHLKIPKWRQGLTSDI